MNLNLFLNTLLEALPVIFGAQVGILLVVLAYIEYFAH